MAWRDFLYFFKRQRLLIVILLFMIFATLALSAVLTQRTDDQIVIAGNDSIVVEFEKLRQELVLKDSLKRAENSAKNYARVSNTYNYSKPAASVGSDYNKSYSPTYTKSVKLSEGETILLNKSDTAQWKMIPGIGTVFASRIVEYRDKLGGYIDIEQLREVFGVDAELYARIIPYIDADYGSVGLLINSLEFKELLNHPYLNYKQVKAIVNLRKKRGSINSVSELGMLDEFTSDDIRKLIPYLDFQ